MQPKQIHELLDFFYKKPVKAVELVKKMLVSDDESTYSVWVENEKLNKFDSTCEMTWHSDKSDSLHPNWPHLTIFCNTCGIVNSSPLCLSCFMRSSSKRSRADNNNGLKEEIENKNDTYNNNVFEDLKFEPHPDHDVYFEFTRYGRCSCGDINSMNPNFFCPFHSLQPTNPPNVEIFGSDHCDFITDLTDICFRSLIVHASRSTENVKCIVNFLLDLAHINSSYLHLIAAALSENFDSSALFTHWPQFLTKNAIYIVKLIEILSIDDSFQYAFTTSFFDNYIYLLSHDLNTIESINPSTMPTSTIALLAASDIAWSYFINHEEMIEDFSIAELIGKEFYILTSFVRSDPFHPIVSHSLIRNFFNTMSTFFSSSDKFFKIITSPESISKITDIFIDALTLETFPIVTKKYNFYDFSNFRHGFKYLYNYNNMDFQTDITTNPQPKESDAKLQDNEFFSGPDSLASFFSYEKEFECDCNPIKKTYKYSMDKHLILRNFDEKIDSKYTFMRCALKFKKNLFCAIEHLSDLFQSPDVFIMPLLCGMIKMFFSTMSPDQFSFQNDFLSSLICFGFNENKNDNLNIEPSFESENNNNNNMSKNSLNDNVITPIFSNTKNSNQNKPNFNSNDDHSVTITNLLNLELNSSRFAKRRFIKPKNTLDSINFTHYYESKEPFFFRSVLDDMPIISCSAPCHSITFRKFCKYSTNGIEDWKKALKEANVFEIMFSNSSYLRNTFKSKTNKDIENEIDQEMKTYLEDIALLTITIIPMRICALNSLLSLGVTKVDNSYLKKQILKPRNVNRNTQYDDFLRSIFPKNSLNNIDIFKDDFDEPTKNIEEEIKGNKIDIFNMMDNEIEDNDEDIDEYEDDEDYEEYDDINEPEAEIENDEEEEKSDSNYLYYNLFLKFADFRYDTIGSFAGSICALSFASNIGYLSLVTYCIFDLKNGITSKKLFAYLNFLICCISDRAVYAKDDEKLFYFFIRNLLSKRGKMTGLEILKECDRFFSKRDTFLHDRNQDYPNDNNDDNYYVNNQNDADDFLIEDNDYEDILVESKMKGKQVDELDSFELLSGKSHSYCKKLSNRFSRPIINRILKEIAEPVYHYEKTCEKKDFNQISFKLRDEFNDFKPSIFNSAKEAFNQWSNLIRKYPTDAFLKMTFDNDYKPSGFSPQSVLLSTEFFSILFIIAIEATNSGDFDRETIQIFFAILNYIKQFNYFYEESESKTKSDVKNIKADNLSELIKNLPSTFSQFQITLIKYKNYPETTFNDLLLKFGKTGEIFINQPNDQKSSEKNKPNFDAISEIFKKKQLNYFDYFVQQFDFNRYFSITKRENTTNILNTISILIFDGFSGRQIWTSASACKEIQQQIKIQCQNEKASSTDDYFIYNSNCGLSRKNAWLPANLNPNFKSLISFIDDDLEIAKQPNKDSIIELFIKQFGFFDPEKNLFNIIQNTIENVELRLRSNPFVIDDARPKILLGNSFRVLWTFVQKRLGQKNAEKNFQAQDKNLNGNLDKTENKKIEIIINRSFNYRNNDLWNGASMSNSTILSPYTNRLTLLLSLLLISENPIEDFLDILNFAYKFNQSGNSNIQNNKDGNKYAFEYKGITFIIEDFNESTDEDSHHDDYLLYNQNQVKDVFFNLVFLRCAFIVSYCCLWNSIEAPNGFFDPENESSFSDLYSLLFKNNKNDEESEIHHLFNGVSFFSFIDLPNNFFGFSEFPFAAEIMNNNVMCNKYNNININLSLSTSSSSSSNIDFNSSDNSNNKNDEEEENDFIPDLTNSVNQNKKIFNNSKYLSNKEMKMIKRDEQNKLKNKKEKSYLNLFACSEAVDVVSGEVGDFDSLIAKSDFNCSVLISLAGKDAGLCYAYNKSLSIENIQVEPVYLTLFGENGIGSGELLYLNKDRVLKLEDSFLSGELFL